MPSPRAGSSDAPEPWIIRPAGARAKKQWDHATATEPELMAKERDRLRQRPLDRGANPRRTHRLKGPLSTRTIGKNKLPQWQHEITGAGRIWYCPDKDERVVWVTHVELRHPKATE